MSIRGQLRPVLEGPSEEHCARLPAGSEHGERFHGMLHQLGAESRVLVVRVWFFSSSSSRTLLWLQS